jgi:hypothetical protein
MNKGVPAKSGLEIYDDYLHSKVVSGTAPIKDSSGKVIGAVVAELSMEQALADSNRFGLYLFVGVIGSGLVFFLLLLGLFLRRNKVS